VDVRQTRRGTTIRLTAGETTELLTALALSMAAYGILQNFMTPAQKGMALPSMLFVSQLGAATWDALAAKPAEASPSAPLATAGG
jgi:hypothetical protein